MSKNDEGDLLVVVADRDLILGDEFLDELWHATARAPQRYPGSLYAFGLDVLGAAPVLETAATRKPGYADKLKTKGERAIAAGQRVIASSRRYKIGKKIGQKALAIGNKAVAAGKKEAAAAKKPDAAAKAKAAAAAKATSTAPKAPGAAARAAAARVATAAVTAPTTAAKIRQALANAPAAKVAPMAKVAPTKVPVAAPMKVAPVAAPMKVAPTLAPKVMPKVMPTATTTKVGPTAARLSTTRFRGITFGAEMEEAGATSAVDAALEAAAGSWAELATLVDQMNALAEEATAAAQAAEAAGVDVTDIWSGLSEAFADEGYSLGFVTRWANYAYGPEIGEAVAEAQPQGEQWMTNMRALIDAARTATTEAGAATEQAPTDPYATDPAADPYADPYAQSTGAGSFNPGSTGGYSGSEGGGGGESDDGSSEAIQRFRESGGAWDPFYEDEGGGAAPAEADFGPAGSETEYAFYSEEGQPSEDAQFYYDEEGNLVDANGNPVDAEGLFPEEEPEAVDEEGNPVGSIAARRMRTGATGDSFATDSDTQAFARKHALMDSLPVEDTLAGLDFNASYIFMPHTAAVAWQKEKDAELAAQNMATQKKQVEAAARAAAAAMQAAPTGKLDPVTAMRFLAARRRLAEAKAHYASVMANETANQEE